MGPQQCDDYGRVYEDESVCDDNERRASRVAVLQELASLSHACDVVAGFEKESRDDGEKSGRECETVRDG
jgi:hypothetical protein